MLTDDPDVLYGVPAISQAMGLKPAQVYHLIAKDRLPVFKVGGKPTWSKSGIRRWLAESEEAARREQEAAAAQPEPEKLADPEPRRGRGRPRRP